jgi:hypothetical protein
MKTQAEIDSFNAAYEAKLDPTHKLYYKICGIIQAEGLGDLSISEALVKIINAVIDNGVRAFYNEFQEK